MTIKEMQNECQKNNGKCSKCKLNCVNDWYEEKDGKTWCFKALAIKYRNKYIMHKDRKEKEKAEETLKEYETIKEKYGIK